MEPMMIAGLTVLALLALMLQYYARTFTRAFGAARRPSRKRAALQAVPAVPADGRPRAIEFTRREAHLTERSLVPAQSGRVVLKSTTQAASAAGASTGVLGAGRDGQERTARGIDNTVGELERLIIALGNGEGFSGATERLHRVEERLSEYDLDDLMEIADRNLGVQVIAFYRGVAGTIHEIRECLGCRPSDWATRSPNPPLETEQAKLQRIPSNDVARGRQLAARLRGNEPPRVAAEASWAAAIRS